jgi:hypothetical protein
MRRRFDKKKKNGGTTENGIPTPPFWLSWVLNTTTKERCQINETNNGIYP